MQQDDQVLADQLAAAILADHAKESKELKASPNLSRLSDVFKRLRELNIPWVKILALIGPIIQILTTGTGDWSAIIAAILALFNQAPTTTA